MRVLVLAAVLAPACVQGEANTCEYAEGVTGEATSGFWFASDACKNPTGGSKIAAWIASEEVCDKFGSCEKGGSCSAPATTVKADCTTPATWTNGEVLEDVHEDEAACDAGTWAKYGLVVQSPCTQAQLDKDECMCNHNGEKKKANIFTEGDEPKACWALQGPPQAPVYKLPMCKMYNEESCCAPIHDAETQWSYETLVDVADRCLQFVNEEHFALREFFCIPCDPQQYKYMSVSSPGDDSSDMWGEIRICQTFAERVWPSVEAGSSDIFAYDRCGFSIWTAGVNYGMICVDDDGAMVDVETKTLCTNEGGTWVLKPGDWAFVDDGDDNINGNLVPYGDVNPATGDDPILPSKYWPEDPDGKNPYGSAKERFFNQIKPGMLDAFQFRVVPDDDARGCFKGSGAAGMFLSPLLAVAVAYVSSLMSA